MADEAAKNEGCNILVDGHCAMHGVEVERRKSVIKDLAHVRKDTDDAMRNVDILQSFKNKAIGALSLSMVMLLGCYTYSYRTASEAKLEIAMLMSENKQMREKIQAVREQQARTDERYSALNNQLKSINDRLDRLLTMTAVREQITTKPGPTKL